MRYTVVVLWSWLVGWLDDIKASKNKEGMKGENRLVPVHHPFHEKDICFFNMPGIKYTTGPTLVYNPWYSSTKRVLPLWLMLVYYACQFNPLCSRLAHFAFINKTFSGCVELDNYLL